MSANPTSLIRAAAEGDAESVRTLIAEGVDVNHQTGGGQTALMLAIIGGHEIVVRLLSRAGADPHLKDRLGLTAFDWVERRGFHEFAKLFEVVQKPTKPTVVQPAVRHEIKPPPAHEARQPATGKAEDKSQRWLAGVKQRWQEEELRQQQILNAQLQEERARTEFRQQQILSEPPKEEILQTDLPTTTEVTSEATYEELPYKVIHAPSIPEPVTVEPTIVCPLCKKLHDRAEPCVVESKPGPAKSDPAFLASVGLSSRTTIWVLVVITLLASGAITHFLYGYFSSPTQVAPNVGTQPTSQPVEVIKNSPALSDELTGKEVSLPEPDYPTEAKRKGISGTVVVRIRVNRRGRVVSARSTGGDWHLRRAAVDAARRARFDPTKLPERGVSGTISYNFQL